MGEQSTRPDRGLEGTGALVTGGGSGIGLAVACRLALDGAAVTICGRNEDRLAEAVATIKASAPDAVVGCTVADVTDEAAVQAAVKATVLAFGGLDLVVNNGPISTGMPRAASTSPMTCASVPWSMTSS